jgi:ubiquinone/menaquinone biosynthesis C-methylase UbiE
MSLVSMSNRWNQIRYRGYAPVYDKLARVFEPGRKRAIEQLDLDSDDRILVLGAGTGSDLEYLPRGAEITTIDITPAMVRRTEARADSLDIDVDARVGDAQALEFEKDRFDVVLLHLILTVVPDPEAVIAETSRVLASDGRVSIYDKFIQEGTQPSLIRRVLNPFARFLFSDLTRQLGPMLAETGLEIETRSHIYGDLYTIATARPANR